MRLTQKNFDDLCETLNHRMTEIENSVAVIRTDLAWIKKIAWAGLSVITTISGVVIKFVLFS